MVAYFKHRKPKKIKINEKKNNEKEGNTQKTTKTLSIPKVLTFAL
jgi:hypothetical protein